MAPDNKDNKDNRDKKDKKDKTPTLDELTRVYTDLSTRVAGVWRGL
jgi:hypothetical protein